MSKPIFFSIIIPTYNRAHMILQTLETAFAQTYPYFEVIFVDDGSTDNTENIIKSINHKNFVYLKKPNEERAVARNTGFNIAKGEYLTLLDSDDFLYPNHLEEAVKYIEANSNPEIIRFNYDVVDSERNVLQVAKIPDEINEKITLGNFIGCSGIILRKDIAAQYTFNADRALSGSEDYELWLRLAARFEIHTPDKVTCSLHSHKERSVIYNIQEGALIERIELLIKYAFEDIAVKEKYKKKKSSFISFCLIYASLHLAIAGFKKAALKYLLKAMVLNPMVITDKRFYGIIKTLLR
ncbi:MAG TPA: glycosyltransferase [Chitinophagales bacterium]|nr:glycosyltransferase [Chitinophagales bacterium]